MRRKEPLKTGQIYHIFNRSIAGYTVFNNDNEYTRMLEAIKHYQLSVTPAKLSWHIKAKSYKEPHHLVSNKPHKATDKLLADIVAYCLMPTHFHLILRQREDAGISTFVGNIQNSYARYFNLKHKRRGPLWEGKFKNILVDSDEQLMHLTRYLHLNPTTANLVQIPEKWIFSSYREYISEWELPAKPMCRFQDFLEIFPDTYKTFTEDQISYQKELGLIKHLTLE